MADFDIKSETINKGLDIVADSTKETRKALDVNTSKGIHKFLELLKSTPIGIKIDTYIAERPYKLEKAIIKMKSKYEQIPEENRVEPSSYIALQTINNLNYCLDEEYLRNAFINILISDMDNRKKTRVKPAYIEIVKQMSREDVEFLKLLNEKTLDLFPILQLSWNTNDAGYILTGEKILIDTNNKNNTITINSIVLTNLLRLSILSIPDGVYVKSCNDVYEKTFKKIEQDNALDINLASQTSKLTLGFRKEALEITPLGKEIIDICLS